MNFIQSSLLLISFFTTQLFSCAGTWQEMYLKDEYYNFIDPDMVNLPRDNPLYKLSGAYTSHTDRFDYFSRQKKEVNIKSWHTYFKDALTPKEIEALFYHENSIEKSAKYYAHSGVYPNFAKYINFLHLQNQLAQNNEQNNTQSIIDKGLNYFDEEQQVFLKERYLYLLMRLYHHNGQYNEMLELYANNFLIINDKGVVKEWIDALRAGAYQHLNQEVQANQLYAHIFATSQTNPHYGYYDFKVNSDASWKNLLATSPDNNTTALYYFLRAMQWKNEPLHELKNIASIAPNSIWFERLAYMIMQELQNKRYEIMVHAGKKDKYFQANLKSYTLQKNHFLTILKQVKKQTFFTLYSKLYLNVLEYNSLNRNELLTLRDMANPKQKPYAKLLTYIYGLHQLSSASSQEQHALYVQLKPLLSKFPKTKQTSILRYTALQLSTLNGKNTIEKSLNKLFSQNENHRSNILLALNYCRASKLEAYVKEKERSFFEEKVFKKTMHNLKRKDVATILATLYLQENNFKASQHYLRKVPEKNLFNPYNPFNVSISTSNRKKSKTTYSQKKFVETMLRLESALIRNPKSAKDHFLYANGLYNKSWFGNFPMSSVLYRSSSLVKGEKLPKTMDLSQAEKEYELALKYALEEEFRAKIAYQLLKIKFNQAITNSEEYDQNSWSMPHIGEGENGTTSLIELLKKSKDFPESLKDFRSEYEHTNYAKEVISKCITFKYF